MPRDDNGKRAAPRTLTNAAAYAQKYKPVGAEAKDQVRERKEEFDSLNAFVTRHRGWITSVPGDKFVDFEALPDSPLPDQLRALGYHVEPQGNGQRMLPAAIVERFDKQGALITEGSTLPVSSTRTHAGLVVVNKYWFDLR